MRPQLFPHPLVVSPYKPLQWLFHIRSLSAGSLRKKYSHFPKRFLGRDKSEKVYLLLTELLRLAQEIEVKSKITICRDPSDNLELCLDSKAEFLITYDKDLLDLSREELERDGSFHHGNYRGLKNLKIVKPSEFLLLLK